MSKSLQSCSSMLNEKKFIKIFSLVSLMLMLAGCAGMSRTEQNVLGGGAVGAGLGAAIGAATGGDPATGAAIGGAAGLVGGAIKDSYERNGGYYGSPGPTYYYNGYPPPPPPPGPRPYYYGYPPPPPPYPPY